jgi:hypothetical protein
MNSGYRQNSPVNNSHDGRRKASPPKDPLAGSETGDLVQDRPEGLDLGLRANLFQAVAILACSGVGACIGYQLTDDAPWLAASAGGLLGMVLGAFASGFVLMFRPRRRITLAAATIKCEQLRRRLIFAAVLCAFLVFGMVYVVSVLGHDDSPWAFVTCVAWLCLAVGVGAYAKGRAWRLRQLRDSLQDVRRHHRN